MQVSVPGMKKKPAPYSEQTLTYSTALALTGRSAACAPLKAIRPAAELRMSVRAVIIEVSRPAIHAIACATGNPKILLGNDNNVMPLHLDRGCDVFATREASNHGPRGYFHSDKRRLPQQYSSLVDRRIPVKRYKTHICTSARTRRPRFTGQENPVPTVAKATAPNRPAIQGRDRHEARRRHCGNHEAGGDRNPLRLSGQSSH